ncbi:HD domain-containing phosphohydrolase [Massilia sp. DWR3-1-1]|uniref:HD domain-containing phosphohydrolase n=1 Tax=Massilia sp. DWR3-1-1 TaxID=2804559 RepID=UPI003CF1F848
MAILIVDDNTTNLLLLAQLVRGASERPATTFEDPVDALEWCEDHTPELVLVDYRMPTLSGVEFISLFRRMPGLADVPIIMITTENEARVREQAREAGATDFVAKPVEANEFRLRVRNLLQLNEARTLLADRALLLQREVAAATAHIADRERELVTRLARAAEYRDPETGAHLHRMAQYSALIARQLDCPPQFCQRLLEAAPMHDIGKLGTPDYILLKPGRLDDAEMAIMRQHAAHGAHILAGSASPLMQLGEEIARCHHERFNGSGYPQGLAGAAIPLSARIVAVADVFDALSSPRPYKRAWSLTDARAFLEEHSGSHFCPDCVAAFVRAWAEVLTIHASHPDAECDGERI